MRIICRRHLPQCKRKTAAICTWNKGGNEHGNDCLYASEVLRYLSLTLGELNIDKGFSEQSIPGGVIVGSLCGSTNQRFAVTCKGDFPFPFQVPMINIVGKKV